MKLPRFAIGLVALGAAITCPAISLAQYPTMFPYVDNGRATAPDQAPPAGDAVALARNNLNSAQARVAKINQQLNQDQEQITTLRSRLAGGDAGLADLRRDLDQATAEMHRQRTTFEQAAARYHAARGALEQAMADAGRPVGASPQSRAAVDAIAVAKDQVHLAQSAATQRLAASQEYHVAYKNWEDAQQRVESLRAKLPANAPALKDAIAACQASRQKVEDLRNRTLDSDPAVREARSKLAEAESNSDAVHLPDKTLAGAPAVARAQADLTATKAPFDPASSTMQAAEQKLADAQAKVQAQLDGMNGDRKTVERLQNEVAALQSDLTSAQADVNAADQQMNSALAMSAGQTNPAGASAAQVPPNDYVPTAVYPAPGAEVSPPVAYDAPPTYVSPPAIYTYPPDYYAPPFIDARIDLGGFVHHRIYIGGGRRSYGYRGPVIVRERPGYSYHHYEGSGRRGSEGRWSHR